MENIILNKKDMSLLTEKQKRKRSIIVTSVVLVLVIMAATCAIYLGDYYRADMDAIEAFASTDTVEMQILKDETIVFEPEGATQGVIFYPGGKVEYTAYIPLMKSLASEGVLCVLVEMPFNLAVLDVNAADGIREQYPQIRSWYIGGHSLGGSMAASYLADNANVFEGLILLGSYSTADLSNTDLAVLSVYGSEDQVLNREKYEANKVNLPADFSELVIAGGCHAYFGMYGAQDGDGIPSITNEEQIRLTMEAIVDLLHNDYRNMGITMEFENDTCDQKEGLSSAGMFRKNQMRQCKRTLFLWRHIGSEMESWAEKM